MKFRALHGDYHDAVSLLSLELPAIGVRLSLAEVYDKVDFSAEPSA
jgi:hypothetical protein